MADKAILGLTSMFEVDEAGEAKQTKVNFFSTDHLSHPLMTREGPLPLDFTVNLGSHHALVLQPGAACVIGKPDSGKTLFANTLYTLNHEIVEVIRYREPEEDSLLREASWASRFSQAMNSSKPIIFTDSLRTTFYTSGGATGKGGVNMGIFILLTAYDVLARRTGKVLLFSLNPMTTDEAAFEYYIEAARGSVSHTIYAVSPKLLKISSRASRTRAFVDVKYEPQKGTQPTPDSTRLSVVAEDVAQDTILDLYTHQTN
jgi:hypothetical protein